MANGDTGSDKLLLKDVYAEIGTNYRFFKTWRERLLAGYLAVLAGLSIAYKWTQSAEVEQSTSQLRLELAVCGAGLLITVVFWLLEFRNSDLFLDCLRSGKKCEEAANLPEETRVYSRILSSRKCFVTQSRAMNLLFLLASVGIIAVAIGDIVRSP